MSTNTNTYILGIGSNMGDRYANIRAAIRLLMGKEATQQSLGTSCSALRTSFLYETPPMYLTDQPPFLNGAVSVDSHLEPLDMLKLLKEIEAKLGRDLSGEAVRNGPRPVDLDILLLHSSQGESIAYDSDTLTIPHPRMAERAFVLTPLMDVLAPDYQLMPKQSLVKLWKELPDRKSIVRVLPLTSDRCLHWNETLIMGVLNVTPDSFSDGNQNTTVEASIQRCLEMERQGAHVVDVGGESTRPGAKEVAVEEELQRTLPVIHGVRKAIEAGADIVNDVSGGRFDESMLSTVGELGVPFVIMHSKGTPATMSELTYYDDVVEEVGKCLALQSAVAAEHGIYRWLQIVDPGVGFAKDMEGNLSLLRGLSSIRSVCGDLPLLLGTSRKGFLGRLTGVETPNQRDPATMASSVTALALAGKGPAALRVHNVADCRQATKVLDAIVC